MQIMPNEVVYYFSYIAFKGGCGNSGSRENYWIALTNKRVVYKTKVMEDNKNFVEKDGILPLEKISFIEVTEGQSSEGCGCSTTKVFQLRISSSGGTVVIPIPTKEKGYEIRKVYSQIAEMIAQ
ncbi:PH domain-containing protein [Cohnella sp. GCM10012308]|uniref:PH domain-containing protein n=1 Tax=Cohnella sp. GCM10012308 TaxID=3317329 RepID=UPI00360A299E